ncbi:hypothetical protein H7200_01805 [Candidatus Saccharibacteria bacterium]|nr:hypothetical protein [Candidatus Saccharibacteria bacterium]
MQPENSWVPNGPEQAPVEAPRSGERIPVLPTPESGIETGTERVEQPAEASAAAADAARAVPGQLPPVAIPTTPILEPPTSDSPLIAADEDVIEKEWVDKAKKIIDETKNDPYARSNRVNELQKAYLQKRYNKELGSSE